MGKPSRASSCVGKTPYPTKQDARDAAGYRSRTTGAILHSYKCRYCNGFHVGHVNKFKQEM